MGGPSRDVLPRCRRRSPQTSWACILATPSFLERTRHPGLPNLRKMHRRPLLRWCRYLCRSSEVLSSLSWRCSFETTQYIALPATALHGPYVRESASTAHWIGSLIHRLVCNEASVCPNRAWQNDSNSDPKPCLDRFSRRRRAKLLLSASAAGRPGSSGAASAVMILGIMQQCEIVRYTQSASVCSIDDLPFLRCQHGRLHCRDSPATGHRGSTAFNNILKPWRPASWLSLPFSRNIQA